MSIRHQNYLSYEDQQVGACPSNHNEAFCRDLRQRIMFCLTPTVGGRKHWELCLHARREQAKKLNKHISKNSFQPDRPPCTLPLPGKTTVNTFSSPAFNNRQLGKPSEYKCSLPSAYRDLHDSHPRTECKTCCRFTALPNSLSPSLLYCLNSPQDYSARCTELLNNNPQGLAMRCRPVLCSASQGKEGLFQRKPAVRLSAPSRSQPKPWRLPGWDADFTQHLGWGARFLMPDFPSVALEMGSRLTNPNFSWLLPNSKTRILCEGKLNQVTELWQLPLRAGLCFAVS